MGKYIKLDDAIGIITEHQGMRGDTFKALHNAYAVDIVRCKDCKWIRYCETEDLDLYLDCDCPDGGGIPRNEGWYCADGERKESE